MGTGHAQKIKRSQKSKQLSFEKTNWQHRLNHGGSIRNKRLGRKARPLSTKASHHVVFKAEKKNLRRGLRSPLGFQICLKVLKDYSHRFHIKIQSQAICGDHVHLVIRIKKRSLAQHFLRVVAGQIAQRFEKNGFLKLGTDTPNTKKSKPSLWRYRPFTRVVLGYQALKIALAYVRLNEKEAQGVIPYSKTRLRGLSNSDWELLWS